MMPHDRQETASYHTTTTQLQLGRVACYLERVVPFQTHPQYTHFGRRLT